MTSPTKGPAIVGGLVLLGLLFVAVRFVSDAIGSPETIPSVTFQNPTSYDLRVEVSSGPRDGWTPLGIARKESTTAMGEVADQGETWIFRFASQGQDGGEAQRSREALRGDRWIVQVPEAVGEQLERRGAPPSP